MACTFSVSFTVSVTLFSVIPKVNLEMLCYLPESVIAVEETEIVIFLSDHPSFIYRNHCCNKINVDITI